MGRMMTAGAAGLLVLAAATAVAMEAERAAVCTAVEEREPVGAATSFPSDVGRVYCFSELTGVEEAGVIHHVWYWGATEVARIPLPVEPGRFRTWSLKTIPSAWRGDWLVRVESPAGETLAEVRFEVAD